MIRTKSRKCRLIRGHERVTDPIYMADGHDTGGVIEQIPEEGIPAGRDGVMHGFVGEGWGGVGRTQDEVELLRFRVPPFVPGRAVGFTLGSQGPELCGSFGAKGANECREDGVTLDVADVKVVEVAEGAGEVREAGELDGAWV